MTVSSKPTTTTVWDTDEERLSISWLWIVREKLSLKSYFERTYPTIDEIKISHGTKTYPRTCFYLPYDVTLEEQIEIEKILKNKNLPFDYEIQKEEDIPDKGTHRVLGAGGEFSTSDIVNNIILEITKTVFNFDIMAYIKEDYNQLQEYIKNQGCLI